MTWLAPHVRRAVGPGVRIGQVRYGTSSWNQLDRSRADVRSAPGDGTEVRLHMPRTTTSTQHPPKEEHR